MPLRGMRSALVGRATIAFSTGTINVSKPKFNCLFNELTSIPDGLRRDIY